MTSKLELENDAFAVIVFNNPLKALKFTAGLYDFLLNSDVRISKMDGFELYGEVEKIDHNLKMRFIIAFVVYYESLKEIFLAAKVGCFF